MTPNGSPQPRSRRSWRGIRSTRSRRADRRGQATPTAATDGPLACGRALTADHPSPDATQPWGSIGRGRGPTRTPEASRRRRPGPATIADCESALIEALPAVPDDLVHLVGAPHGVGRHGPGPARGVGDTRPGEGRARASPPMPATGRPGCVPSRAHRPRSESIPAAGHLPSDRLEVRAVPRQGRP
ncbi:hypothetical protein HBB16_13715 [Pseudonocardia sp. MCCB 268]|nr:hypothetical protein [Pseudonocardia cytotoxica]